jgi:hypothetical protein
MVDDFRIVFFDDLLGFCLLDVHHLGLDLLFEVPNDLYLYRVYFFELAVDLYSFLSKIYSILDRCCQTNQVIDCCRAELFSPWHTAF